MNLKRAGGRLLSQFHTDLDEELDSDANKNIPATLRCGRSRGDSSGFRRNLLIPFDHRQFQQVLMKLVSWLLSRMLGKARN